VLGRCLDPPDCGGRTETCVHELVSSPRMLGIRVAVKPTGGGSGIDKSCTIAPCAWQRRGSGEPVGSRDPRATGHRTCWTCTREPMPGLAMVPSLRAGSG
jgi:hypothetical protein